MYPRVQQAMSESRGIVYVEKITGMIIESTQDLNKLIYAALSPDLLQELVSRSLKLLEAQDWNPELDTENQDLTREPESDLKSSAMSSGKPSVEESKSNLKLSSFLILVSGLVLIGCLHSPLGSLYAHKFSGYNSTSISFALDPAVLDALNMTPMDVPVSSSWPMASVRIPQVEPSVFRTISMVEM
jgi:hypothetical protein